jgi:hypothetical protein
MSCQKAHSAILGKWKLGRQGRRACLPFVKLHKGSEEIYLASLSIHIGGRRRKKKEGTRKEGKERK